jgi:methionyl-tRNA formyltransferase
VAWRIVFFGTPSFAVPTLQSLLQGPDQVIAVVTQPDRQRGRGRKVAPSRVKELALRHGLLLFQPEKVREVVFNENLKKLQPDLIVVVAYGQILPRFILEIPEHGAVNVHASLLPRYRGAAPIVWAILGGERVTGVTTMMMDEGMDTGDILLQVETLIGEEDTSESLHDRLATLGARLLVETVEKMRVGTIRPVRQDHSKATYAPPLKKDDGRIDWKEAAIQVDRRVRAFNPWPVAFTEWEGKGLKIYGGKVREGSSADKAGMIVWVGSDSIEVQTGKGSYLIREVQPEGKRRMAARDFLAGHTISVGTVFR